MGSPERLSRSRIGPFTLSGVTQPPIIPGPDPDQPQVLPPVPPPAPGYQQAAPQQVFVVRQGLNNNGVNAAGVTITVIVAVFVGIPLLACLAIAVVSLLGG